MISVIWCETALDPSSLAILRMIWLKNREVMPILTFWSAVWYSSMQFMTITANITSKKLMFIMASFRRILLTNPEYSLTFPRISKKKYVTSLMSWTEVKSKSANLALPSKVN